MAFLAPALVSPDLASRRDAILAVIDDYGTQKAFAAAVQMSESRISRALDPAKITDRRLAPIERAIARVAKGDGGETTAPPEASGEVVHVPTAPYGHSANWERTTDNTDAPSRLTTYHKDTLRQMIGSEVPYDADGEVALRLSFAVGDSMAPFIPNGAPFIYTPEGGFVDGARYALWLGPTQADVIKRIEVQGGGVVRLVSDNPAVAPKLLQAGDEEGVWTDVDGRDYDITILGRVVWPLDTPQAVVGQLADFARTLLRQ